jgi:hypothetical protein
MTRLRVAVLMLALVILLESPGWAHGIVGNRFFPATLAIDELALPSVTHIKGPEGKETEIAVELAKTITRDLGISVSGTYRFVDPADPDEKSTSGFDNPSIGLKYTLLRNAPHEAALSLAFEWNIGGVGKESAGAASFHTISPSLLFGKGFGDLPDSVELLRPIAITGVLSAELPLTSQESNALVYGVTLQYSLPYLQTNVRDVGLPRFLSRLIPIVELLFSTPIDGGKTTGTVNPGVIWAGKYFEVGLEAIIPLNSETGKNVGVRALVHVFLDDLYPTVFRPIFQ